ncbi:PREDICTED: uncharacterized protein LOC109186516 [Ipomoea nil]|uniref:uncharacterized protein LOC109186516 n=1 Tax=Ipomoea nil TaxID=35883 RepID=UPI0009020026|nr:PREDICTED: uncharacterized protein LOC109186516 [Ipomoea nil]XP_019192069.1 PREDICTED: uncharacterized protein LOC109186516 [Ipomoea nil]
MDPNLPSSPTSSRKFRFAPKPPPRRAKKKVELKTESNRHDASDDEAPDTRLLRRANEHLTRGKAKAEKKAVQVVFSHGVASSAPIRTYGNPREGTADSTGLKGSGYGDPRDLVPSPSNTNVDVDEDSLAKAESIKKKKREYREPWDYKNSYYPITLPLRKPNSGDPEILDEAEFGEAARNAEYDETKIHPSSELGLLDEQDEDERRMFFIQIPNNLPSCKSIGDQTTLPAASTKGKEVIEVPTSAKGKEKVENPPTVLRRRSSPKKGCSLEELPGGYMGKMLVYKSGGVKLKLGNILYDVSPGVGFSSAQEVVAINTVDKNCCKLGGIYKHAVVLPDIDSLLDSDSN